MKIKVCLIIYLSFEMHFDMRLILLQPINSFGNVQISFSELCFHSLHSIDEGISSCVCFVLISVCYPNILAQDKFLREKLLKRLLFKIM